MNAIRRLLDDLRNHDEATYYHVRSVGRWCRRLATQLGAETAAADFVERAGALHDVGKLCTPLPILNKPSALTSHEWHVMRAHAAHGADLCAATPGLEHFAPVVRWHHERLDGRGYPDGLAGDAIPFESQVIAVADAFHAMISHRSYATAKTPREAFDELAIASGSQFGPRVVAALFDVVGFERRDGRARRFGTA